METTTTRRELRDLLNRIADTDPQLDQPAGVMAEIATEPLWHTPDGSLRTESELIPGDSAPETPDYKTGDLLLFYPTM